MSIENPLWGAPRIHCELLKLGFQIAQSSVAKYMAKRRGPPSQGWCTFLRNHAPDVAAMDLQATRMNEVAVSSGRMVLVQGSFSPLPWIDEMFDKVLLVNVVYFFDSDGRTFQKSTACCDRAAVLSST
jgi:hypothetical protein